MTIDSISSSRLFRWSWPPVMLSLAVASVVGFTAVMDNPDLVDIPVFTTIFTSRGVTREMLIWILLIMPAMLAFAASTWLFLGAKRQPFPLLFGIGLVGLYMYSGGVSLGLRVTPGWDVWARVIDVASLSVAIVVFALFPNGRWVPRWSRWACLAYIFGLLAVPEMGGNLRRVLVDPDLVDVDVQLSALITGIAFVGLPVVTQVIRYRWHATQTERQQTKWIMFGIGLMTFPVVIAVVLALLFTPSHPVVGWLVAITAFSGFVIPVAAAIAITKYRLYDLNHVVSRTVTYTVVVGLVAATYALGVVAVQTLLPEAGSFAVAASTLAAVAVSTPLRRWIQHRVDRRFNRARFDGEREAAAFASKVQSSPDLDLLTAGLLEVLTNTVQPTTVTIWTTELAVGSGPSDRRQEGLTAR